MRHELIQGVLDSDALLRLLCLLQQRAAGEVIRSLVGSEMCMRDKAWERQFQDAVVGLGEWERACRGEGWFCVGAHISRRGWSRWRL